MNRSQSRGFTLIELLLALAIAAAMIGAGFVLYREVVERWAITVETQRMKSHVANMLLGMSRHGSSAFMGGQAAAQAGGGYGFGTGSSETWNAKLPSCGPRGYCNAFGGVTFTAFNTCLVNGQPTYNNGFTIYLDGELTSKQCQAMLLSLNGAVGPQRVQLVNASGPKYLDLCSASNPNCAFRPPPVGQSPCPTARDKQLTFAPEDVVKHCAQGATSMAVTYRPGVRGSATP